MSARVIMVSADGVIVEVDTADRVPVSAVVEGDVVETNVVGGNVAARVVTGASEVADAVVEVPAERVLAFPPPQPTKSTAEASANVRSRPFFPSPVVSIAGV